MWMWACRYGASPRNSWAIANNANPTAFVAIDTAANVAVSTNGGSIAV